MSLSPREEAMMDAIGKCMMEEIENAVAPLRERIAELEKGGIKYAGTFQRAQEYKRGRLDVVRSVRHESKPSAGQRQRLAIGSQVTTGPTLADSTTNTRTHQAMTDEMIRAVASTPSTNV